MKSPAERAVPRPPSNSACLSAGRATPATHTLPRAEELPTSEPPGAADRWDSTRTSDELGDLQNYLTTMPIIEQAKGMLMTYYGLDADTAFGVLRRWSQTTNTKLSLLSARLVEAASQPDVDACGALRRFLSEGGPQGR